MKNENTIYTTDEVCSDTHCDGYGCAPCSIQIDGYFTPAYRA